ILGRDVVERADLVVLAPAPPVLELVGRLADRLLAHLNVHRMFPPACFGTRPQSAGCKDCRPAGRAPPAAAGGLWRGGRTGSIGHSAGVSSPQLRLVPIPAMQSLRQRLPEQAP